MEAKQTYKILVLSDTHGDVRRMNQVILRELPFDALIHCGDSQLFLDEVLERRESYDVFAVRGNCDFMLSFPELLGIRFGSHKVMVTHGHRQEVDYSLERLLLLGRQEEADVILFGHTHVPLTAYCGEEGTLVLNPGSLTRPRQYPRKRTYAILTLEEGKRPQARMMEAE